MRKRSKYRPKGVILNTMAYVVSGFQPLTNMKDILLSLQIKNHSALEDFRLGKATKEDIDTIISALNVSEALAINGLGNDYKDVIKKAQDALYECAKRGATNYKFVAKGPELKAIIHAIEIHDAQLEASTVKDIELATNLVNQTIIQKKARPIVERV